MCGGAAAGAVVVVLRWRCGGVVVMERYLAGTPINPSITTVPSLQFHRYSSIATVPSLQLHRYNVTTDQAVPPEMAGTIATSAPSLTAV
jgi:hypothetical protein